jgi:hypothetical protein
MGKQTQQDTIIKAMLMNKQKKWWSAKDFQQMNTPHFVGYEATARMSEVINNYPQLVERGRDGRFRTLRIKWEDIDLWISTLPKTIKVTRGEQ